MTIIPHALMFASPLRRPNRYGTIPTQFSVMGRGQVVRHRACPSIADASRSLCVPSRVRDQNLTFQNLHNDFRAIGSWPSGKAPGFGPGIRRFESCRPSQVYSGIRDIQFIKHLRNM